MLSKILRGDEMETVQPLSWRQTGRPGPVVPSAPVVNRQTPLDQPFHPINGMNSDEARRHQAEVESLQARIRELEQSSGQALQQARDSAYREGENAGRTQATAQIQSLLEKLAHSIREVADLRPKLRHEAEGDLLKLALAIAKKVLHREVTADPEALSGLVRVALDKIRSQEILRVRVHPQHHAPVQQLLSRISNGSSIDLVPDGRLTLGDVVIDTTRGEFDGSIDTQLREIERGLVDRLRSKA